MSISALQGIARQKGKAGLVRILRILAGTERVPISLMELKSTYYAIYSFGADVAKLRAVIETESTEDWMAIGTRISKEMVLLKTKALARHWVELAVKTDAKPDRERLLIARQKENNARRRAA